MSDKSPDNFARAIAVLSLIMALAAIVIPYSQQKSTQKQQQEQFEELQSEELSVKLNPSVAGKVRLTQNNLGPLGHVVHIPWELTVSNTGSRQLSITKYDLSRGDSPESMYYSGIDGGLVTKDSQPVGLPLTLEPGETKSFFIFVGITVPQVVYDTLKDLNDDKTIGDVEATIALAKKGVDLYGNTVEYNEFEGGAYLLSVDEENQNAQRFWFTIHTGRENTFTVSASKYEIPGVSAP